MNQIRFQQHIRTSSKARRGFRTYQRAASIDEVMDEKLGSYGVYTPTVYPDLAAMEPARYPELFLFYALDNKKVICKSVYIGLDLHSYPARAGNYISHALVYEGSTIFNPVDLYKQVRWKTGEEVKAEDGEGVFISEHIDALTVTTDPGFLDTTWFENLIVPDRSGGTDSHALAIRQEMFRMAVDGILQRKKIIIIDRKEMLIKWTMTLLQVFPLEFVFKYLSIASFTNTSLLLDVCNVLCFEKENSEKAYRYSNKAMLIDFDGTRAQQSSAYAQVLLKVISANRFNDFSREVFPQINPLFTVTDFDNAAWFYDKLYEVNEMSVDDFRKFLHRFVREQQKIQAIFEEVRKVQQADKCEIIWDELKNVLSIKAGDLSNYKQIASFVFAPATDSAWVKFELQVARQLGFTAVSEVAAFYSVTNMIHAERSAFYFERTMAIMKNSLVPNELDEGILFIHKFKDALTGEQQQQLQGVEQFLQVLDKLKRATRLEEKYLVFREATSILDEQQLNRLRDLLPNIDWKDFFTLMQHNNSLLRALYAIQAIESKLPHKELGCLIANNEYLHGNRFGEVYDSLKDIEKIAFDQSAIQDLQEAIIKSLPIASLTMVEGVCKRYEKARIDVSIAQLTHNCKQMSVYDELWRLCDVIQAPDKYSTQFPVFVNKLRSYNASGIYAILDDDTVLIPSMYENLAVALQKKGALKRHIPKSEMIMTTAFLRSICHYEDIVKVKATLKKHPLTVDRLLDLVKLPWPWFAWKELFEQLDDDTRLKLPKLLSDLLDHVEEKDSRYSALHWQSIICQYVVFLVKENLKEHFDNFRKKLSLSEEEKNYIVRTLLNITDEKNELYEMLLSADRSIWNTLKNSVPKWSKK